MKNPYKQRKISGRHINEHRLVMENIIGRKLTRFEFVHHINGNKMDNRPENLRLVTPKEHAIEHGQWKYPTTKKCVVCGIEFVPSATKRGIAKTCSKECRYILVSMKNRNKNAKNSIYRDGAYPCQIKNRKQVAAAWVREFDEAWEGAKRC